ncbi:MAG: VanZ family protein [Pyrinomonadaceae bacterium]
MDFIGQESETTNAKTWRQHFWRYAPLAVWLCFIFFASTDTFSATHTSRVLKPLLLYFFPHISETRIAFIHHLIRKGAHFSEYAVLAVLAARTFVSSSRILLRRYWFVAAFALVAVYALFDEYHQSFIPTRTASIYDSLIDMTGGVIALFSVAVWLMIWRRFFQRRFA